LYGESKIDDYDRYAGNRYLMEPIKEFANWDGQHFKFGWNNSAILTELIHAAGRWCERFASDLFIDWVRIEQKIADGDDGVELFGFRKDGVDHSQYIFSRADSVGITNIYSLEKFYRALYKLTVRRLSDIEMEIKLERVI